MQKKLEFNLLFLDFDLNIWIILKSLNRTFSTWKKYIL